MVTFSIPAISTGIHVASASGMWSVRLPRLGEAVIVACMTRDPARPWCAYRRATPGGWRTLWLGSLQISHKFY